MILSSLESILEPAEGQTLILEIFRLDFSTLGPIQSGKCTTCIIIFTKILFYLHLVIIRKSLPFKSAKREIGKVAI